MALKISANIAIERHGSRATKVVDRKSRKEDHTFVAPLGWVNLLIALKSTAVCGH